MLAATAATTNHSLHFCDGATSAPICTIVRMPLPFRIIRGREEKLVHERPTASFRAQALVVSETNQSQRVWVAGAKGWVAEKNTLEGE